MDKSVQRRLEAIDPVGLVREAYAIDGISAPECRAIFLDWALRLPDGIDQVAAIADLLVVYGQASDHPMTALLKEGLGKAGPRGRRGGRAGRIG